MTASIPERLTDEQKGIIEASDHSITVTAYAGTGKTSTLKALAASRPKERILYLAFNKALAEESRLSFNTQTNVEVRTIHSLAWRVIGRNFNNLANPRCMDILPFVDKLGSGERGPRYEAARVVLDAFNSWLLSDKPSLKAFFRDYGRHLKLRVAELAREHGGKRIRMSSIESAVGDIWKAAQSGGLPMPHNGYLKLFQLSESGLLNNYDRILVDEAQDLNDCMIDIIKSNRAKKVLVGDPYQQIYGFNGAVNALAKASADGAANHFLTQSFRCPAKVADLANQYLRLLDAPKPFKGVSKPVKRLGKTGELVIARTNAGLFDFVAKNLAGNRFFYNGGFDGYEFHNIIDVVNIFNNRLEEVKDPFLRRFKTFNDLSDYAEKVRDVALSTRMRIGLRYSNRVYDIFKAMRKTEAQNEGQANFVITTAHKIKGREYETVTLLEDFVAIGEVIGQARATKTAFEAGGVKPELVNRVSLEEFRLIYVSITRSFKNLLVSDDYMATTAQVDELQRLADEGYIELAG